MSTQYSLFDHPQAWCTSVDNSVDNVKNSLQFRRDFNGSAEQNREQIMNIPVNNRCSERIMGTDGVRTKKEPDKIP